MLANRCFTGLKEFNHLCLCKPHGLSFQLYVKLGLTIFTLIDDYFVV